MYWLPWLPQLQGELFVLPQDWRMQVKKKGRFPLPSLLLQVFQLKLARHHSSVLSTGLYCGGVKRTVCTCTVVHAGVRCELLLSGNQLPLLKETARPPQYIRDKSDF